MSGFTGLPRPRLSDPFTNLLWDGFIEQVAPVLDEYLQPKKMMELQKSGDMMMSMVPALLPSLMPTIPQLFEALDGNDQMKDRIKAYFTNLVYTMEATATEPKRSKGALAK